MGAIIFVWVVTLTVVAIITMAMRIHNLKVNMERVERGELTAKDAIERSKQ